MGRKRSSPPRFPAWWEWVLGLVLVVAWPGFYRWLRRPFFEPPNPFRRH